MFCQGLAARSVFQGAGLKTLKQAGRKTARVPGRQSRCLPLTSSSSSFSSYHHLKIKKQSRFSSTLWIDHFQLNNFSKFVSFSHWTGIYLYLKRRRFQAEITLSLKEWNCNWCRIWININNIKWIQWDLIYNYFITYWNILYNIK